MCFITVYNGMSVITTKSLNKLHFNKILQSANIFQQKKKLQLQLANLSVGRDHKLFLYIKVRRYIFNCKNCWINIAGISVTLFALSLC